MLKYYIKRILHFFLHALWIIPIDKKKYYFESFTGKSASCNPYYIFDELYSQNKELKYIWCFNSKEIPVRISRHNVKIIKYKTLSWFIVVLTSKTVIFNGNPPSFLPFRKKQIVINTWHGGGAYKRTGKADNLEQNNKWMEKTQNNVNKHLTYLISSCSKFTKVMIDTFNLPEKKILEIGMPRNDIFFDTSKASTANKKVRNYYNIPETNYLVLYAPTYRGHAHKESFDISLDYSLLTASLRSKFQKDITIMFRGHSLLNNNYSKQAVSIDATNYEDMQELLCAADMLITDYSSSMWDFSITKKPCLLYTPDIQDYINDRGFYTDPYSWGFPIIHSKEEIEPTIKSLDQKNIEKAMITHQTLFGTFENGLASKKFINQVLEN